VDAAVKRYRRLDGAYLATAVGTCERVDLRLGFVGQFAKGFGVAMPAIRAFVFPRIDAVQGVLEPVVQAHDDADVALGAGTDLLTVAEHGQVIGGLESKPARERPVEGYLIEQSGEACLSYGIAGRL